MAEDYKKNFNINDDEDPCCLYVRHIPASFTEEEFCALIEDGGRTIKNVMLNKKGITTNHTYGFVHFHTHEDALLTRNELNGSPPLYLQICFSKKRKDVDKNEYRKNVSKGRGIRIDIDGQKSISQKLKVTTGDSGRRVTVLSPEKNRNESSGLKSPCPTVEKYKAFQAEASPQKSCVQKSDVSAALTHNPYCNCFCCGKKAEFACVTCKKPYCSASCQSSDWITHKRHCKQMKETSDLLIKAYKSHTEALDSSYLSESSNSDFEKTQECSDVKNLLISPGVFEKVSVTNINNPSKFWVHLEKYSGEFSKVQSELSSLQKHSSLKNISCRNNLLCCAVYKNKLYRGRILKEKSRNEAIVYLLDYGETVTTQKSDLFSLPEELRKLPAQAVCCKLVDETMKDDIDWNAEDILSFQLHAANKTYRAHILRCDGDIYEVSLINQDGISVFSILAEAKKTVPCVSESLVSENDGVPPSVWSKLKPKTEVKLVPVVVNENDIWCYLLTNEDLDNAEIIETEELMKNYSGKDISLCVEEGEFAAGFSEEFKQFFRCVVLKRKRSSFSVRYIDYGNEEEITRVSSLSEKLIKKWSYIVNCVKPTSMSLEDLMQVLRNAEVQIIVKKISSDIAELTFNFQGEHIMFCHPCYPCIQGVDSVFKETDEAFEHKKDLKNTLLPLNKTFRVKVVFIKSASELYVQLIDDEHIIKKLFIDLNKYCNSAKSTRDIPVIGDIVGCKLLDGTWYRALIREKRGDTYCVTFIDFGDEREVHLKNIQVLPEKFKCPKFAVCVSLSEIKNEDLSKYSSEKLLDKIWDMDVITETKIPEVTLSIKGTSLKYIIKKQEESNKMKKTNLTFKKLPVGQNVSVQISCQDENYLYLQQIDDLNALIELSSQLNDLPNLETPKSPSKDDVYCGLFSDNLWYRVSIEEIVSPNMYKVFFLDFGNYKNISRNSLKLLPSHLFSLPVFCIPVIIKNREEIPLSMEEIYVISVTGDVKDVQEVKFSLQYKEDAKLPHISSLKKKQLKDGLNEVEIIWFDEDVYYCHLSSDNDDVLTMFNNLQTCPKEKLPAGLSVGDVICAQSFDGYWYRASVLSNRNPSLKVFFLDYGNNEDVTIDRIKFLPKKLLEQPTFAIPMRIENLQEIPNSDDLMKPLTVEKIKLLGDNLHVVKVCLEIESTAPEISKTELLSAEKFKYKEVVKLRQISSLKKKHLKDGLNEVKIIWVDKDVYYCQLSSDNDDVLRVFNILQTCPKEKPPAELSVGDVICAQSSDGCWYRASVLSNRNRSLKVFFLDYGNNEDVTIDCIKFLPKELLEQPTFAIPMRIENLQEIPNSDDLMKPLTVEKIKLLGDNLHVVKVCLEIESTAPEISKTELVSTEQFKYKDVKLPHISSLKKKHLKDGLNEVKIIWVDKDVYYCQLSSDNDDVLRVFNILQTCPKEKPPAELSVGNVICAQSSDGCWYRASVLSNRNHSLKVFFLDYGNNEDVTIDCIKFLPKELLEQPTFAIRMRIENLQEILNSDDLMKPLTVEKIKLLEDNLHVVKACLEIETTAAEISKTELVSTEKFKYKEDVKLPHISSLKKQQLKDGLNEVKIIWVDNDVYYCQLSSDNGDVLTVFNFLQTCPKEKPPAELSIGDVICARSSDGCWYRASVLSKRNLSLKVFFLDYGNNEDVTIDCIKILPKELLEQPTFAIRMRIENLQEILNSDDLMKPLTVEKIKLLEDNLHIVKACLEIETTAAEISKMELVSTEKLKYEEDVKLPHISSFKKKQLKDGLNEVKIIWVDKDVYYCQLSSDNDDVLRVFNILQTCSKEKPPAELSVGDVICAQSSDGCWYRASVLSNRNCSLKVFFLDYGNNEDVTIDCIKFLPKELLEQPTFAIPVRIENLQEILNSDDLMKPLTVEKIKVLENNLHVVKACLEIETTSAEISKTELISTEKFKEICEIEPSNKMSNSVEESKRFTFDLCKSVPFNCGEQNVVIYNVDEDGYVFCAPFINENIEANILLPQTLTEHCNHRGIRFNDGSEPEPSEMVLALFPEDNQWYRGTIIDKLDGSYFVNFVDYGNIEQLELSSLCKMEEQFMELDVQAHMCTLTGFSVTDENKQRVCEELKKFTVFNSLEPLKAVVEVRDNDITLRIPKIISFLVEKQLVTRS